MRGICTLAVTAIGMSASADVINGSFEVAALPDPGRVDMGQLANWTSIGGFSLLERGVNGVSFIAAHTGAQFVSMGHNGAEGDQLFQVFATEAGRSYDVSYWIHCIQGSGSEVMLSQVLDTATGALLGSAAGTVTSPTQGWMQVTYAFVADSDSSKILFTHTSGTGGANIALDTVSVVPAPASLALLGLGLTAGRRRQV